MTDRHGMLLSSDLVGAPGADGMAPTVDAPPPPDVRRAADLLRLLASLAALALMVLVAVATRDFARRAQQGLLTAATALPPALRDALVGTVQAVAMLAPLAALVFAAAGQHHGGVHLDLPVGRYALPAIVLVLAAGGLLGLTPPGRRFLREKVWPFLRAAGTTLTGIAADPAKLTLGVVGMLGLPLIQIVGLALSLHALGGDLPFAQLGAAFMAARLLANAAPVPGGLGALEAGLIAGLTALGVPAGPATSAVLVYRLLTFWLNVPLGAVALGFVQRRGYV